MRNIFQVLFTPGPNILLLLVYGLIGCVFPAPVIPPTPLFPAHCSLHPSTDLTWWLTALICHLVWLASLGHPFCKYGQRGEQQANIFVGLHFEHSSFIVFGKENNKQGIDMMFPQSRHSASSQQLKFTTSDSCDRIKDEFQFLQAQYHSLKLECDKLASEKSEMQRHYIMYYEMSYGLNIEMHKQAEIVKRLNGICAQVLPYLSQEHQQQVLGAIERAKQVTPPEMNSIIRQQLQAHQLSQLQGLALPMTPMPLGLSQSTLPAVTSSSGLFSLSSILASQAQLAKEEKASREGADSHREEDGDKSD
ncbi:unnamed protein product [Oncorhynchus mykiss]|uniref:Groucho/TLE N-terminal Q-rich domain-containing protein n=5 Tax=Salmonidae TaxID=8015 RepID=A0A060X1V2_ONCMY|nr:unnamed protein product [Oncorhynchus mykiss]